MKPEQGKSQAIELSRHDNYRLIKQAYSGTVELSARAIEVKFEEQVNKWRRKVSVTEDT